MATPSSSGGINLSNVATSIASTQVERNQNWIRLSLANNLNGTESMKDVIQSEFKCGNDKEEFHSWIAKAKLNKKCTIQKFIWPHLLGDCTGGCPPACDGETDIDKLDITAIRSIYDNLEHIIPSTVMLLNDILLLKEKFNVHVESIKENRNGLAHYPLKMKMPNKDFKKRWISIRKALYGMCYTKIKNFDDLRIVSLDPYLRKQVELINNCLLYTSPSPRDS